MRVSSTSATVTVYQSTEQEGQKIRFYGVQILCLVYCLVFLLTIDRAALQCTGCLKKQEIFSIFIIDSQCFSYLKKHSSVPRAETSKNLREKILREGVKTYSGGSIVSVIFPEFLGWS